MSKSADSSEYDNFSDHVESSAAIPLLERPNMGVVSRICTSSYSLKRKCSTKSNKRFLQSTTLVMGLLWFMAETSAAGKDPTNQQQPGTSNSSTLEALKTAAQKKLFTSKRYSLPEESHSEGESLLNDSSLEKENLEPMDPLTPEELTPAPLLEVEQEEDSEVLLIPVNSQDKKPSEKLPALKVESSEQEFGLSRSNQKSNSGWKPSSLKNKTLSPSDSESIDENPPSVLPDESFPEKTRTRLPRKNHSPNWKPQEPTPSKTQKWDVPPRDQKVMPVAAWSTPPKPGKPSEAVRLPSHNTTTEKSNPLRP